MYLWPHRYTDIAGKGHLTTASSMDFALKPVYLLYGYIKRMDNCIKRSRGVTFPLLSELRRQVDLARNIRTFTPLVVSIKFTQLGGRKKRKKKKEKKNTFPQLAELSFNVVFKTNTQTKIQKKNPDNLCCYIIITDCLFSYIPYKYEPIRIVDE